MASRRHVRAFAVVAALSLVGAFVGFPIVEHRTSVSHQVTASSTRSPGPQ